MTDRTIREGLGVGGTVREGGAGATLREGVGSSSQSSRSAWLPGVLADRFEIVEDLPTRGSEADLYVVANADGRRLVAKIYRRGIQPKEEILGILKHADFAHVVQLEEFGEEDGHWWELIEYIEHSSLKELIDQEGPKLSDATTRKVLQELNDALKHLHGLPIEHRDLKPDNVLVRTRAPLDLVLADFGIASVMDASVRFTDTARTIRYAPPEAIGSIVPEEDGNLRNVVAIARTRWDYWSLGMIIVEILTGEHPYSGISEAAIGHRLATQNVDDLVEGIEEEGWRKLCRGLLRRDPGKRWGTEQVSMWLANERDWQLTVEDEIGPSEQTVRGIDFDGRNFPTPESLGTALSEDWSKAESFWKRRLQDLQTWIIDTLGQQDRGKALDSIDKDQRRKIDAQVFSFIYILAPSAPLRFKGVELSPSNLELIAKRAAEGDRSARTTLLSIYENDILTLASALEQGKGLSAIARNWRDAVGNYRSKLQDVERNGARAPALEGDTLVKLLAAALPVSSVVSELRTAAQRATTVDAKDCSWFRDLGNPDTASVGAVMIMPHVIREAEAGAKERRYDSALKNFGVPARLILGLAGGLVGGIATAYVPGFVVYWPIVWIWGEQIAITVALLWMVGCAIVAGQSKWIDLSRIVGNDVRDHQEVRIKGLTYSAAGAAVIAGVLLYGFPDVRSEYQRFAREEANDLNSMQLILSSIYVSGAFTVFREANNGETYPPPFTSSQDRFTAACPIASFGSDFNFQPIRTNSRSFRLTSGREYNHQFRCRLSGPSRQYYSIEYGRRANIVRPSSGFEVGEWTISLSNLVYSDVRGNNGRWRTISSETFFVN
jgi:serine/threonine protein kinase